MERFNNVPKVQSQKKDNLITSLDETARVHQRKMKTRKLKNGNIANELEKAITLKIYTKCPNKYKLIDMETGEEYIGSTSEDSHWTKVKSSSDESKQKI